MNTIRLKSVENPWKSLGKHSYLRLAMLLCLTQAATASFGQTYNAPYDIPRFKDFIGESKLQAPTSSTIADQAQLMAGYTSSWFYVADGDKVAFNQSGSSQRTELRHLENWVLTEGDRSLHGTIKIVQQTCAQVTVLQIHDDANAGGGPNKPLLRIYKHQTKTPVNHLWAAIKTDAGGVNTTHVDLGAAPDGYFSCDVKLVGGNMVINIDGVEKANMDVSYWTFPSYWKAGVYLQDAGEATAYFDALYTGTPAPANNAPSVNVTSPLEGASFDDGDAITLTADASDRDGSISQVEFFVNGNSVGVDRSSPYELDWTIGVGTYSVTAVATDNQSASSTSAAVTIICNSVAQTPQMYVSAISTGTQSTAKGKSSGTATITVVDESGYPVANASVTGTFSGTFNETATGSTDDYGVAKLISPSSAKGKLTVDFCVDAVSHSTFLYNRSLNKATCSAPSVNKKRPKSKEESLTADGAVLAYPNPITSSFTLKVPVEKDANFSARVIGVDGKVLSTIDAENLLQGEHTFPVDLSHLNKGIYLLETVLNGERKTCRLVKN